MMQAFYLILLKYYYIDCFISCVDFCAWFIHILTKKSLYFSLF